MCIFPKIWNFFSNKIKGKKIDTAFECECVCVCVRACERTNRCMHVCVCVIIIQRFLHTKSERALLISTAALLQMWQLYLFRCRLIFNFSCYRLFERSITYIFLLLILYYFPVNAMCTLRSNLTIGPLILSQGFYFLYFLWKWLKNIDNFGKFYFCKKVSYFEHFCVSFIWCFICLIC